MNLKCIWSFVVYTEPVFQITPSGFWEPACPRTIAQFMAIFSWRSEYWWNYWTLRWKFVLELIFLMIICALCIVRKGFSTGKFVLFAWKWGTSISCSISRPCCSYKLSIFLIHDGGNTEAIVMNPLSILWCLGCYFLFISWEWIFRIKFLQLIWLYIAHKHGWPHGAGWAKAVKNIF